MFRDEIPLETSCSIFFSSRRERSSQQKSGASLATFIFSFIAFNEFTTFPGLLGVLPLEFPPLLLFLFFSALILSLTLPKSPENRRACDICIRERVCIAFVEALANRNHFSAIIGNREARYLVDLTSLSSEIQVEVRKVPPSPACAKLPSGLGLLSLSKSTQPLFSSRAAELQREIGDAPLSGPASSRRRLADAAS